MGTCNRCDSLRIDVNLMKYKEKIFLSLFLNFTAVTPLKK